MSLSIAGMSWVTPLGSDVDNVWQRLLAGETAPVEILENEQNGARYLVRRVPANTPFPAHPRLRRASAISRFAAAAGLAALPKGRPFQIDRIAVVFAISNGGVIYTRRFYSEIVKSGAQAASPLLFPETVFNAPASHLAAILGINGASYTVVGDGAVGVLALKLAEDLLASDDLNFCLVVGAEEIDPLVCEAYRQWRFLRNPKRAGSGRGMILSEGAGAILLERSNGKSVSMSATIEKIVPGKNFFHRSEALARLGAVVAGLENGIGFGVGSANGTFIDRVERAAVGNEMPLYSPKIALGESVGASVLWQVIAAVEALKTGTLPGVPSLSANPRALVLACGLNQQTGGLTLQLAKAPY